ncbi:MAG TPA: TolC family protein [Anaeromyxobacteraceae bacterium]|nr:TolC family protein [Anaeromyxobacteraceae bacterium]
MSARPFHRSGPFWVLLALGLGPALVIPPRARADPPRTATPERVSFAEAMRRASLKATPSLIAADEVRRAEALLGEVRSSALPFLSLNPNYTRLDSDRVSGPSVVAYRDAFNANAALQLPLLAASHWTSWAHAGEQVEVAKKSEADVRRTTLLTAARAYLAILAQRRVIDVSKSARDIAQVRYDFAHARFVGGIGNVVDAVRAEQQLAAAKSQLANGELGLVRAQEALGILAGEDVPLDAEDEPRFEPRPEPEAFAAAEAARTDLKVAQARLSAAEHVVRDSWLDWLPTLLVSAEMFYNSPATATTPETGWQVQFLLSMPIYDGGLKPAQRREREALEDEARAGLDETLRQVRSDVRLGFEEVSREEEALSQARLASDRARTALTLTIESYRAGATNDLDVSTAQQQSRDADLATVIAEDGVRQARLDLLAGIGQFP